MNAYRRSRRVIAIAAVIVGVVGWRDASANMGVPMLALVMPWSWWLLVPIIVVVAAIANRVLSGGWRQAFKVSALANGISTLVGVPLTWFLLLFLDLGIHRLNHHMSPQLAAVLHAPFRMVWVPPYYPEQPWLYPLAAAGLCIPFFAASVFVEYRVARWLIGKSHRAAALRWGWLADGATYSVIAAWLLAWSQYRRLGL
jgi:hypothetical protein